jgi:hypothetical protein
MPLIKLTDQQLDIITRGAEPLHPRDRGDFLRAVAAELSGREIGDSAVGRAVALAQARYFWPPDLNKARDQSNIASRPRSFRLASPGTHVKSGWCETVEGEAGTSSHCV